MANWPIYDQNRLVGENWPKIRQNRPKMAKNVKNFKKKLFFLTRKVLEQLCAKTLTLKAILNQKIRFFHVFFRTFENPLPLKVDTTVVFK